MEGKPGHKPRLTDVDSAKGLAIFLVVLGHLTGGTFPKNAEWYIALNHAIYRFHMPFFMFLSGLLVFYTYQPIDSLGEYGRYVSRRIRRFAPSYLLFGSLMLIGKVVGQWGHLVVDHPPDDLWMGFYEIIVHPYHSHAATLWYVYTLCEFCVLLPIVLWLCRNRLEPVLVAGLAARFIPVTYWFGLEKICEYAFVFFAGAYVATRYEAWTALVDRYLYVTIAVFLMALGLSKLWPQLGFVVGLLSLPALHGLCRRPAFRGSWWLQLFGKYTLAIYLMNTLAAGLVRGVILKFTSLNGARFVFIAPVLLTAGLAIPLLLKIHVFPKIPWLDRITD